MRYFLFYDPASYKAGASIFDENGKLISWSEINGNRNDSLAVRLKAQLVQLNGFVSRYVSFSDSLTAVIENVYGVASQRMELGASAAVPLFLAQVQYHCLIPIQTWRAWLRSKGVTETNLKGTKALNIIAPEINTDKISDDVADSIIFGLYYFDKRKNSNDESRKPIQKTRRNRKTSEREPTKNT